MKRWCMGLALLLGLGMSAGNLARAAENKDASAKPNVVFFLVDDLGWRDLGCFGSTFYETPNVDKLCQSGMKFTRAYAACQVCSPTRGSILTGKYPPRIKITTYINTRKFNQPEKWKRNTPLLPAPYQDHMDLEEVTLAEAFKEAGYATFFAGKWHLGTEDYFPEHQGFDHNKGGLDRGGPYGGKKYFSPYGNKRLKDGPPGEHLPDRLATETVKFMEENKNKPFFAYLSFYSVHTPLMAREDLRKKYKQKAEKLEEKGPEFKQDGNRKTRQLQKHAVYGGMVDAMDQAVGKVLNALDRLEIADRTIVVFMSDNGGLSTSEGSPTSNLPLRAGKGWMFEGGIREPMIIRWPGVTKPNATCNVPVISTDFYPTLLEIAGIPAKPKQHVDGVSMVPLLKGKTEGSDRYLYWHFPHYGNQGGRPSGAVMKGDWKLIERFETGQFELYNLADDMSERKNLVEDKPKLAEQMKEKLKAWQKEVGAVMPQKNPKFDPKKKQWK